MTGIEIREATPADAPGIRRLFARVFQAELPAAEWEWKFARNPDGWFGVVAVKEGEIVGNYAGWGMRQLFEGEVGLCYSVGDVATDPEIRGIGGRGGVYRTMVARFYAEVDARGVPFCFGFPNARALEISNRLAGTRTQFPIVEIHVAFDAFRSAIADAGRGDSVNADFDPLWEAASRILRYGAVRDRDRANWRFHARPSRYYRMVWLPAQGPMRAWAALSVMGEKGLVADYLATTEEDLAAVFDLAAAEARTMGATRLVFWEAPGGPARELLSRLPGERREAGFVLAARIRDPEKLRGFAEAVALTPAMYDVV